MTDTTRKRGPLSHLRVLDFTQFLAGPYATMILGDLGAEVIKVENPAGELARQLPPYFVGDDSLYYLSVNRNKKSIAVDLKSDDGKQIVHELIRSADVVIENFRPGVMKKLGFDAQALREENPELIWCSISGFGQDGPSRDLPAYDMIVQALSGGMSLTGEQDGASVRAGVPIGDLCAGMFAVIGILAAATERGATGRGRLVDISMLDCQISMLSYQAAYYLYSGIVPGRQGRGHESIPTYRSFTAGDGRDVVVTANTEDMWRRLCSALRLEHLADDPRFATNKLRLMNRRVLSPILEEQFLQRSAEQWVAVLQEAGVPVGEVKTLDLALSDPQVLFRKMVVEMQNSAGERIRTAGNPVKLDGEVAETHRFPPPLGADTEQVLIDLLRRPESELKRLRENGVISSNASVA